MTPDTHQPGDGLMAMTTIVQVPIRLTNEEVERAVTAAIKRGFTREDPRRSWTPRERRQALRYLLPRLLYEAVGGPR